MYERSDNRQELFSLDLSNMEPELWWHHSIQIKCPRFNSKTAIAMNINSKLLDISFNIQSEYHPYNSVIKSHSARNSIVKEYFIAFY
jgi:hypothetical protein